MAAMENGQDLAEQPVKKAKMQDSTEESLSQVGSSETSEQKVEQSSNISTNHAVPGEILPCADYILRANDYTSQLYPAKPYTHILSVPVAEPLAAFSGQAQYQTLQQSQPYTVYPQASQTYGLPPFGALWPGIKSESGLIQTPSQSAVLTSSGIATSQSSPVLYSYPVQAPSTNASSAMPTPSPTANISVPTVTSISNQEYPTYTILGQNQYQQCYPNQSFSSAVSSTGTDTNTGTFQVGKEDNTVQAQVSQQLASGGNIGQCVMRAVGSKETDEQSKRTVPVKNRGKGKKAEAPSLQPSDLERVFLWDLDETIIIFHSLLTGSYAQKYGKDPALVVGSGLAMEEMIFEVADTHLFFNDLEECDQVHVEDVASDDNGQDLSNYSFTTDGFNGSAGNRNHSSNAGVQGGMDWMRKLAFRYRKVIEVYEKYKSNVSGKESCFERIVTRFGKKVTYVVIGDGKDEEMAAKQHNMPFWRITNHNDLISLQQALELDFL
ncbi:hypothetical protein GDO86_003442 [Hymenochirus boettgeri]|uniref:Eyes absent homolog n=1 Tax=Hymenochirus boettgeri TaxID=247094 RepID=A0A8T2K433_9PIPI|nr:hypothetical protein GDO86_003442 [Hymenochirus boettgeri]